MEGKMWLAAQGREQQTWARRLGAAIEDNLKTLASAINEKAPFR